MKVSAKRNGMFLVGDLLCLSRKELISLYNRGVVVDVFLNYVLKHVSKSWKFR